MRKFSNLFFFMLLLLGGWSFSSCEPEQIETPPVVKGFVISASSSLIIADGEDESVLTVKFDGVDVTDSAFIYMNKKRMNGNRFTTDKPGDYEFFASYKGKVSKTITIKAANPALYVSLPKDDQESRFSDFQRKVLIAEGTGTWCGYCPYMITALDIFSKNASNADKAVIVATHSGDEFSNAASDAAIRTMKISSFPSCVLNLNPDVIIENGNPDVVAENINSLVGMELKEEARVGISAATAISVDSTLIAVRAAVKVGTDGHYRINAWLIEDGVSASQSSNWPEFSNNKSTVVIDHMHILRDASSTSPIQGKLLGEKETCTAGDVIEFYHEFDATMADVANVANCKIVVMVSATSGTSSNYFVNNVIECGLSESVPFAYN